MESWNNLQKVPENPYLYTKIEERMKGERKRTSRILPALQLAFVVLIIAVNAYALWNYIDRQQKNGQNTFATSYGLDEGAIYDYANYLNQ